MLAENPWKNSGLVASPRDSLRKSLIVPVPKEHHDVEYRHSRVADVLQIGWETNTSHAECENSRSSGKYSILSSLLGACAYKLDVT